MNDVMQSPVSPVSGAVLAAGSARRMNGEKLLLDLGGKPIVRVVVEEALAAGLTEVVVIVNAANAAAVARALEPLPTRTIVNPLAAEGMGTSIALAAASIAPTAAALLLLQGDQPLVDREMLRVIVAEWAGLHAFVASSYAGLMTTPVLFARELFRELAELREDRGARSILERHGHRGKVVPFPEWRGADVDTPEDYRRACDLARSRTIGQ